MRMTKSTTLLGVKVQKNKAVTYHVNNSNEPVRGFLLGECPAFKDVHELLEILMEGWSWVPLSSTKACSSIPRAIVACLDHEGGWVIRTPHASIDMEEDGDAGTLVDYFADWVASDSKRLGAWAAQFAESGVGAQSVRAIAPQGLYHVLLGRAQRRLVAMENKLGSIRKSALGASSNLKVIGDSVQSIFKESVL